MTRDPGHIHQDQDSALSAVHNQPSVAPESRQTVIIHANQLYSDCLMQAIKASTDEEVLAFPSVEAWLKSSNKRPALFIVHDQGNQSATPDHQVDLLLANLDQSSLVVVIGDCEQPGDVFDIVARGARGYIPTSMLLNVTLQALHFVRVGGVFVPACSLVASSTPPAAVAPNGPEQNFAIFTTKQTTVLEAIRRGKPNKTIAYELNMCESTVKVHVRNIMKKLKAKNRTQVAFIAEQLSKGKHC